MNMERKWPPIHNHQEEVNLVHAVFMHKYILKYNAEKKYWYNPLTIFFVQNFNYFNFSLPPLIYQFLHA